MHVKMSVIRDMMYCALPWGVNIGKACEGLGIEPSDLYEGEILVDSEVSNKFWEVASDMTGDRLLALHIGEGVNTMLVGKLGYLMQCSKTAGDVIKAICDYGHSVCKLKTFSSVSEGQYHFMYLDSNAIWEKTNLQGAQQALDFTISGGLKLLSTLVGRRIIPQRVELIHARTNLPEYERVYRCPVLITGKRNCIVFRKSDMDLPVLSHDQSLFGMFSEMLRKEAEAAGEEQNFIESVKRLLFTEFKGIIPPIEVVAAHLNMTIRTFQRKLSQEGSSYRELCIQIRKEFALSLMENKSSKLSEIASILGYSDPTAFRRAFKGWVNTTPNEARRNLSLKANVALV